MEQPLKHREIKFRAWDKRNNRMWAEPLTPKEIFELGLEEAKECLTDCVNPSDDFENVIDDLELMQFTGLTDKNGKEIYEGDIIKGEKNTWIVENKFGCFIMRFIAGELKPSNGFILSYDFNIDYYEVIGNIYENPELLK